VHAGGAQCLDFGRAGPVSDRDPLQRLRRECCDLAQRRGRVGQAVIAGEQADAIGGDANESMRSAAATSLAPAAR